MANGKRPRATWVIIHDKDNRTIVEVKGRHYGIKQMEMRANAKLIIAASELLKSCMSICNADNQFKLKEARNQCKEAIIKATS